ncbi:hypothetical protein HDU77_001671 [Chytriomyces hyalinus]|nr:hypothetical protein HDU77_001671 [Chytriomyces hyalinus]
MAARASPMASPISAPSPPNVWPVKHGYIERSMDAARLTQAGQGGYHRVAHPPLKNMPQSQKFEFGAQCLGVRHVFSGIGSISKHTAGRSRR